MEELKLLIDSLNSLDPNSEEYQELEDEIQLLQNDLVTVAIIGEN